MNENLNQCKSFMNNIFVSFSSIFFSVNFKRQVTAKYLKWPLLCFFEEKIGNGQGLEMIVIIQERRCH